MQLIGEPVLRRRLLLRLATTFQAGKPAKQSQKDLIRLCLAGQVAVREDAPMMMIMFRAHLAAACITGSCKTNFFFPWPWNVVDVRAE